MKLIVSTPNSTRTPRPSSRATTRSTLSSKTPTNVVKECCCWCRGWDWCPRWGLGLSAGGILKGRRRRFSKILFLVFKMVSVWGDFWDFWVCFGDYFFLTLGDIPGPLEQDFLIHDFWLPNTLEFSLNLKLFIFICKYLFSLVNRLHVLINLLMYVHHISIISAIYVLVIFQCGVIWATPFLTVNHWRCLTLSCFIKISRILFLSA